MLYLRKCLFEWMFMACVILVALVVLNIHYEVIPFRVILFKDNEHSFRVLSYNVHSDVDSFGTYATNMAAMILMEKPDVVYLTEYYEGTDETLQEALEQHYPYVNRKYRWGENDGDAFYSKWPIDSVQRVKLSGHFCTIFRVQIHKRLDTLVIYCCHLSSNNMKQKEGRWASLQEGRRLRNMEADTLVAVLQKERYPAIVMGDMNDISTSPAVKKIRSTGMSDAWWDGGLGYGSTYHESLLRLRIDHILYNAQLMKLKYVDVIGEKEWSDHRAIVAGFDLENNI